MSKVDDKWIVDYSDEDIKYPKADLISAPDNAIEISCLAARGDYSNEYVYNEDYEDVMAPVDGDELEDKERNLIRKCMLRGHFGVFEHVGLSFGIEKMSRVCMAQITRHRHLSFDVQSMRFVDFSDIDEDDFYAPPEMDQEEVKTREGVSEIDPPSDQFYDTWKEVYQNECENLAAIYQKMIEAGVPKEHARMILPLGTRVNATVSMNLRALFHLFEIRGAGDVQGETNFLAYNMAKEFEEQYPVISEVYFKNCFMNPKRLSP